MGINTQVPVPFMNGLERCLWFLTVVPPEVCNTEVYLLNILLVSCQSEVSTFKRRLISEAQCASHLACNIEGKSLEDCKEETGECVICSSTAGNTMCSIVSNSKGGTTLLKNPAFLKLSEPIMTEGECLAQDPFCVSPDGIITRVASLEECTRVHSGCFSAEDPKRRASCSCNTKESCESQGHCDVSNFFESFYHNKEANGLCNIRILPDTIAG